MDYEDPSVEDKDVWEEANPDAAKELWQAEEALLRELCTIARR